MFARTLRPAANNLRSQIRRYATEPPQAGRSNTGLFAALGTVTVAGGFYMLYASDKIAESKLPAAAKEVVAPGKPTFTGGDQGFVSLVLKEVQMLSHNTKKFIFSLPSDEHVSGLPITSAILTKYKGSQMEKPVIRPYTPVNDEDDRGHIDFVIKKYENGPMSEHMHNMEPGQRLDIKGPIPKYPWSANKHDHVVFIAGGTGITPMYQMMRKIFQDPEKDKTKVTLIYGNVTEDDMLLKRELEDLENTYPQRFRAFYLLDKPSPKWAQGTGYVTKELIKTVAPEPKEENIKIFVCGPPPMYKAISGNKKSPSDQGELSGFLKELGYSKEQVYKF